MLLGSLALLLTGCAGVRYLGHVTRGEVSLLLHRRPVTRVLADPSTPPALARRLDLAQQARRFASDRLGLPRHHSYSSYVALDPPWVAWNVFAAPRFSIDALPQCFPFAGCVAYRGYFRKDLAEAQAAHRRALGDDVWIGPVPAYSTLGWFADPLLSPMLRWDEDTLAGTIFHELSHQAVYVKGDTAFNESFASFVEREGLAQWRIARGLPPAEDRDAAMDAAFTRHVLALRERLAAIYAASDAGAAPYAGGRYLLDTIKGADLGQTKGRVVLDFNFAYNPSCSYSDRWVCPLAPAANRLPTPVAAGERTFQAQPGLARRAH